MAKKDKGGIFQRLKRGLAKTQGLLVGGADDLLRPGRGLDETLYEELEEVLIVADVGVAATTRLIEGVRREVKKKGITDAHEVLPLLRNEVLEILQPRSPLCHQGVRKSPFRGDGPRSQRGREDHHHRKDRPPV